jgi:hypothetical protein
MREIELARADVRYCRDRVALLRAKLYRWGLQPSPRLRELERELQHAEQRLRDVRFPRGALIPPDTPTTSRPAGP